MLILALLTAVIVPAGESFRCTLVRVWGGDGPIWCTEGPRLRIADIAARELDRSCRRGHPCPKASGIKARAVLVELLGGSRGMTRDGHVIVAGRPMQCRSRGPDRYRWTRVGWLTGVISATAWCCAKWRQTGHIKALCGVLRGPLTIEKVPDAPAEVPRATIRAARRRKPPAWRRCVAARPATGRG